MRINIARRGSALWHACVDLARERYARDYDARIAPSPDSFIALCADEGEGKGSGSDVVPLACAGLTYGGERSLLIENYLGDEAVSAISQYTRTACEPAGLVEVGPLASSEPGAGLKLIGMVPALCWCNGASYLLCTVTQPLARTLARIGLRFTGLAEAREDALPPEQQGTWGSYYDTKPVAGFIDLRAFDAGINREAESGYHLAVTWAQEAPLVAQGAGVR
ncbi:MULTISPECIES: thermostable hemolysin [unclassified Streptomyces]|uniref:thermostable hemolysin n=1 Tax=unclassified Streptomyces TaxID=2593676 RepID=UPI003BB733B6